MNDLGITIRSLDHKAMAEARERLDRLAKPPGSLGVLEEIAIRLSGITGKVPPVVRNKAIIIMAGDHGIADEGVSSYPQSLTRLMVHAILRGGAAVNVLARQAGARTLVVDMGVKGRIEHPEILDRKVREGTANMLQGPAMTEEEAWSALRAGYDVACSAVDQGTELIGTGEMGIGNTTASSAILSVLSGFPPELVVGRGTGCDDRRLQHKREIVSRVVEMHRPDPRNPLEVLAKVGGLEIAGLAGCILGAASRRVPVVIDGFISSAAALVASRFDPQVKDYIFASHLSEETGHDIMLNMLGVGPMLHMRMRLGEGTGAALAFGLIDAGVRILQEMHTLDEVMDLDRIQPPNPVCRLRKLT
ncbi:MAG: nicotinate-nucleotide--dimethylbenzimidazole phosphoribosyltransferase [Syntrophomonadaceae bacterium]|nr:nicotinate-nucleotide--dimethylbenzimidazole phosphoribosyltransferase [Syntrophomonadaceae bacterium]